MEHRHGFSLVELSIVLVILGLLTGGILTAQNLIRAAELRNQLSQWENAKAAVLQFKERYFYLPGDMPNARDFWGDDPLIRNGNGSGYISNYFGHGSNPQSLDQCNVGHWGASHELRQAMEHLNRSGMTNFISELPAGTGGAAIPDTNIPSIKTNPRAYWAFWGCGTNMIESLSFDPADDPFASLNRNYIIAGATGGYMTSHRWNGSFHEGAFTPEEAWHIDQKIDDGIPLTGSVLAFRGRDGYQRLTLDSPHICTETEDTYRVTDSRISCSLLIEMPF